MWNLRGQQRPTFAATPGPGQESVWDYPRPPVLRPDPRSVLVFLGETLIADTDNALRLLETASPPTFYLPPDEIRSDYLRSSTRTSHCEWKGLARYWDVIVGDLVIPNAAWSYPQPAAAYATLKNYFAFYPRLLECRVGGERVRPQPGEFYGGWVTAEVVGPFKGEPQTAGW